MIAFLESIYRTLQRVLPAGMGRLLQRGVHQVKAQRARRLPPPSLGLGGDGPVTLVDLRGISAERLDEIAERIAAGPSPVHKVLLLDRPDFLGLRSRGLTFEYIPPRDASARWFPTDADYEAYTRQRIEAIRVSLRVTGPIDRSLVAQSG
ncbi:MAG: hypothetical protein R2707_14995 [Acidimicrobiales bacterium]